MNELKEGILFLYQNLGYIWLIVALLCLFAEIGTPGLFFFVAFCIGSCAASIVAFLGFSFATQCVVALGVTGIAFLGIRHYFAGPSPEKVKTNVGALVNQKAIVIKTISPKEVGRVKVRGEQWPAITELDVVLQKGTVVTIVKVMGNRLVVKE
jgi:membrane protein implicated in regulation of membrane protease activity